MPKPADKINHARDLRKNQTNSESKLWRVLRGKQILNIKFRRQHVVLGFIIDFYCTALKLGIEVDGNVYETTEILQRDKLKDMALSEHGIFIIRITDEEIDHNLPNVIKKLKIMITNFPSPSKTERG